MADEIERNIQEESQKVSEEDSSKVPLLRSPVRENNSPEQTLQESNLPNDILNWSLAEVLEWSETNEQEFTVTVDTISTLSKDGKVSFTRSQDNTKQIRFQTTNEQIQSVANILKESMSKRRQETQDPESLHQGQELILDGNILMDVQQTEDRKEVVINFGKYDHVDSALSRFDLGSLTNSDQQQNLSQALETGYMKIKDKEIPISEVTRKEITELFKAEKPMDGKVRRYHGTSFSVAQQIARLGLLGVGNRQGRQQPTLTNSPYNEAFSTAVTRPTVGERGVVIEFECTPEEIEEQGGYGERISIPTEPYPFSRDRLLLYENRIPNHLAQAEDLRYLPPAAIKRMFVVQGS